MTRAFQQMIDPEAAEKRAEFLAQCRADMAQMDDEGIYEKASGFFLAGCCALLIGIIVGVWIIVATDPALLGGAW